MKRRLNILSFITFVLLCNVGLKAELLETDSLLFEELIYDFGEVKEGQVVEHFFNFENKGRAPVLITKVVTQCGCTVMEYPKDPILPGDTGSVLVKFDSASKMGFERKTVKIKTDTEESLKLVITANVLK